MQKFWSPLLRTQVIYGSHRDQRFSLLLFRFIQLHFPPSSSKMKLCVTRTVTEVLGLFVVWCTCVSTREDLRGWLGVTTIDQWLDRILNRNVGCRLVGYTYQTPSCLRRDTGVDRNPRRCGKKETIPNVTPSPLEWFCVKMGSDESHFNVPITVRGKAAISTVSIHKSHFLTERRAEAESNRGLSAY